MTVSTSGCLYQAPYRDQTLLCFPATWTDLPDRNQSGAQRIPEARHGSPVKSKYFKFFSCLVKQESLLCEKASGTTSGTTHVCPFLGAGGRGTAVQAGGTRKLQSGASHEGPAQVSGRQQPSAAAAGCHFHALSFTRARQGCGASCCPAFSGTGCTWMGARSAPSQVCHRREGGGDTRAWSGLRAPTRLILACAACLQVWG